MIVMDSGREEWWKGRGGEGERAVRGDGKNCTVGDHALTTW